VKCTTSTEIKFIRYFAVSNNSRNRPFGSSPFLSFFNIIPEHKLFSLVKLIHVDIVIQVLVVVDPNTFFVFEITNFKAVKTLCPVAFLHNNLIRGPP